MNTTQPTPAPHDERTGLTICTPENRVCAHRGTYCAAKSDYPIVALHKFYCTREIGHAGDHCACSSGHNLATWPQQPAPREPDAGTGESVTPQDRIQPNETPVITQEPRPCICRSGCTNLKACLNAEKCLGYPTIAPGSDPKARQDPYYNGHLDSCRGMDVENDKCDCGFLQVIAYRRPDTERINKLAAMWDSQREGHHLMGRWVKNVGGSFRSSIDAMGGAPTLRKEPDAPPLPTGHPPSAAAGLPEPWWNRKVTVCDKCLRACCWQGQFMCDEAREAGIVEKTIRELIQINAGEHPEYWGSGGGVEIPVRPNTPETKQEDRQAEQEHAQELAGEDVTPSAAAWLPAIYVASKTQYADSWRTLRDNGHPIISTWSDEAGEGESASYEELSARCLNEIERATSIILYARKGDVLKGALIEAGMALALGKPVYCIGEYPSISRVFARHPLWTECDTIETALRLATRTPFPVSPAQPMDVESGTPETDAARGLDSNKVRSIPWSTVNIDFARSLERRLHAAGAEREEFRLAAFNARVERDRAKQRESETAKAGTEQWGEMRVAQEERDNAKADTAIFQAALASARQRIAELSTAMEELLAAKKAADEAFSMYRGSCEDDRYFTAKRKRMEETKERQRQAEESARAAIDAATAPQPPDAQ